MDNLVCLKLVSQKVSRKLVSLELRHGQLEVLPDLSSGGESDQRLLFEWLESQARRRLPPPRVLEVLWFFSLLLLLHFGEQRLFVLVPFHLFISLPP